MKEPRGRPLTITIDEEILAATEAYAKECREKRNAVIQRFVLEGLKRAGHWPPKREGKA